MKKWLTSLFLLATLSSGVFAGMPFHAEKTGMMECCDKARSKERSQAASAARLCCALNCSDSAPTSSGLSFNFSPSSVTIEDSISSRIGKLFDAGRHVPPVLHAYEWPVVSQAFQPKYIQHHSFLI